MVRGQAMERASLAVAVLAGLAPAAGVAAGLADEGPVPAEYRGGWAYDAAGCALTVLPLVVDGAGLHPPEGGVLAGPVAALPGRGIRIGAPDAGGGGRIPAEELALSADGAALVWTTIAGGLSVAVRLVRCS